MENRQPTRLRRAWQNIKETAAVWRTPGSAGVIGTVGAWTVWYYSSVPCTMMAAWAGQCNPGVFASYITLPVLTSCLGIGAGCATLVGGYNIVMLNRERQRADAAEERAIAAQERANQIADEVRERLFQVEEERRADHRRVMQERLKMDEERLKMDEERLQMERERHQAEQQRRQAEHESRQAADAERREAEQERRQVADAERRQIEQDRRDEHRQFMETQQAMLEAITQLVQRQNGRPSHDANPQQQ